MPLYGCDRCGFTSSAFRAEAARAHRIECPNCDGIITIIFRSDQQARPHHSRPAPTGATATTSTIQQALPPITTPARTFAIHERTDPDGALRVTLVGDLDLAVADRVTMRLAQLTDAGGAVRLDLSQLAFIDSSGVQALLLALTDARWQGHPLDVAAEVSPSVERAIRVAGIAGTLWPETPPPTTSLDRG